ncbi:MAG: twin-arginine translocase TatA/TatE family subunit [Anaerolineales bacterium]
MLKTLGATELIIILVIVVAVFGADKLASLGGALGKSVKEFRQEVDAVDDESESASDA